MNFKDKLGNRIEAVNKALVYALDVGEQTKLRDAAKHIPLAGGKRLRPVLAMLVADAISGNGEKAVPFGVTLELIHSFTLLHDDVMDKDSLRRGVKTVHVLYDEATAINAGDILFALAFEELTKVDVDDNVLRELVRDVAETVRNIGEGQQWDKDFEDHTDIIEKDYLKMIEYKTSVLFRMSTKGGAMIAGGTKEQIYAMAEYGRLIGLGFQVWDDCLDLLADEKKLGKPVGSDIKNGKQTLMVVHALERLKGKERADFLDALGNQNATQEQIEMAIKSMESTGSIEYSKNMALDFAKRAKELLEVLPESESRGILAEIAEYMVRRES